MEGVDPRAFEFALQKIDDGFVFESFAKQYLAAILGYKFVPAGGIHDRGIDGLEHTFQRDGVARHVYQSSIEKDPQGKVNRTVEALVKNTIEYESLHFVTNQVFPKKDVAVDIFFERFKKPLIIYDIEWLAARINHGPQTINVFRVFADSYLHEFAKPGASFVVADLVEDPRLFVFLRQQWEANRRNLDLATILTDTLILYALEGTDPDKGLFKTRDQIFGAITQYVKFDPSSLTGTVDTRLKALTTKPRKVIYHSTAQAYCLPYETRLEIQERNLRDAALYEEFKRSGVERLSRYVRGITAADATTLLEATFHRLFYQQGLEFADFVLRGENQEAFEKRLPDIISLVVEESKLKIPNREAIKTTLLVAIRDLIYNGSAVEKEFLARLSNTYMMLFLLQFDPKLSTYFATMASRLTVYVCTSIIIPAMSEFYLDRQNKRHWNLLKEARTAGVNLVINDTILQELIHHFRMILSVYREEYREFEDVYLVDEVQAFYIDEVMIRAYFYSKKKGQVETFEAFVDNFVSPDLRHAQDELVEWLRTEFGIRFLSDKSLGIQPDAGEVHRLNDVLKAVKTHPEKALSDANLILTIYAIREKNNEHADAGIFGYRTWWLSKDTLTQRAVNTTFKDKYRTSCYIRPDFLHNYICLTPQVAEIDAAYQQLFPTLLGVNISFHMPKEVVDVIHKQLREHKDKNRARLVGILRQLTDRMKVDPGARNRGFVQHFLDEELSKISK